MAPLSNPTGFLCILVLIQAIPILAIHSTQNDPVARDRRALQKIPRANLNIRTLFQVGPGEQLVYPPIDVAGPKPRQAWIDAYNRAKISGQIPDIPPTTVVDYSVVYPSSYTGNPCSYSLNKCNATDDINYPPPGIVGASFDDGPQPPSRVLMAFLKENSQQATHFLIGSRIVSNPDVFEELNQLPQQHMACHSWSHPLLTTLTDEEVVGELGWVMQVMYDKTANKKLCKQWRPPSGDIDDRIRAIGRSVFGLTAVTWSQDPRDWCLSDETPNGSACGPGNGPQSLDELKAEVYEFIHEPQSTGLMILHHEQSTRAIQAYKYIYPMMKKLRWKMKAVPDFSGQAWYQ